MKTERKQAADPIAAIDRVVIASTGNFKTALQKLGEFRTLADHSLKNTNDGRFHAPYGRVRRLINDRTQTKLFLHYRPRFVCMWPMRVAAVPDDNFGLGRSELEAILASFSPCHFVAVEFRLDFPWSGR
jgi:hypothetical protein